MAKKKVKQITRIAIVVDRSGSMRSIKDAAAAGLDEQLTTIKLNSDKSDETWVTLVRFDHEIDVVFNNKNAKDLETDLGANIVDPRGMTAMNDAVMKAINLLQEKKDTSGTAYLIVVISDGMENSSETKSNVLSETIKKLETTGKWTFTFMLSNQDIRNVTSKLGVDFGNVAQFTSTTLDTKHAFGTVSTATANYLSTRSGGVLRSNVFYSSVDSVRTIDPTASAKV